MDARGKEDLIDFSSIFGDINNNTSECTETYSTVNESIIHEFQQKLITKYQQHYNENDNVMLAIPNFLRLCRWDETKLHQTMNHVRDGNITAERIARIIGINLDLTDSLRMLCYVGQCSECKQMMKIKVLKCKHGFCEGCWNKYINYYVEEEKTLDIPCDDEDCNVVLSFKQIEELSYRETLYNYQRLMCTDFIKRTPTIYRCRKSGCDQIFMIHHNTYKEGTVELFCQCGTSLCRYCRQEAHPSIHCAKMTEWTKLIEDSAERVLSQELCPFCQECLDKADPIKKFLGCHRCMRLFCWGCHTEILDENNLYHECKVLTSLSETSRFLLCLQNWMNMIFKENEDLELYLRFQMLIRLVNSVSTRDLLKSFTLLIECRRALSSLWIFFFFLKGAHLQTLLLSVIKNLSVAAEDFMNLCVTEMYKAEDWNNYYKMESFKIKHNYLKMAYEETRTFITNTISMNYAEPVRQYRPFPAAMNRVT